MFEYTRLAEMIKSRINSPDIHLELCVRGSIELSIIRNSYMIFRLKILIVMFYIRLQPNRQAVFCSQCMMHQRAVSFSDESVF